MSPAPNRLFNPCPSRVVILGQVIHYISDPKEMVGRGNLVLEQSLFAQFSRYCLLSSETTRFAFARFVFIQEQTKMKIIYFPQWRLHHVGFLQFVNSHNSKVKIKIILSSIIFFLIYILCTDSDQLRSYYIYRLPFILSAGLFIQ